MPHVAFDRTFTALATLAVAAGTAAGFWVLGTPGQQRLMMGDRQRLEDLNAIANTLYWRKQDQPDYALPDALEPADRREDPVTQELYRYNKVDEEHYKVCANFATDSETHKLAHINHKDWQHPQGLHCFNLELSQPPPSLY